MKHGDIFLLLCESFAEQYSDMWGSSKNKRRLGHLKTWVELGLQNAQKDEPFSWIRVEIQMYRLDCCLVGKLAEKC